MPWEKCRQKKISLLKLSLKKIKNEVVSVAVIDVPVAKENADLKPHYPSGEFKINDTRVIFAQSGTPLLSIAQQYNIPLARIFDFNEMQETETLLKDQLIYLQRKRKTGNNEFHIVKPGETLQDIAQEEGYQDRIIA